MEFHVISVVEFENIWALFNLESVKDLKELIAVKKRLLLIFRIVLLRFHPEEAPLKLAEP